MAVPSLLVQSKSTQKAYTSMTARNYNCISFILATNIAYLIPRRVFTLLSDLFIIMGLFNEGFLIYGIFFLTCFECWEICLAPVFAYFFLLIIVTTKLVVEKKIVSEFLRIPNIFRQGIYLIKILITFHRSSLFLCHKLLLLMSLPLLHLSHIVIDSKILNVASVLKLIRSSPQVLVIISKIRLLSLIY